jgi:hypothetical protein
MLILLIIIAEQLFRGKVLVLPTSEYLIPDKTSELMIADQCRPLKTPNMT